MFLYFLDKNGVLFTDDEKLIDDHTLVALTIMIAESKPEEKDMMITVIMNHLSRPKPSLLVCTFCRASYSKICPLCRISISSV